MFRPLSHSWVTRKLSRLSKRQKKAEDSPHGFPLGSPAPPPTVTRAANLWRAASNLFLLRCPLHPAEEGQVHGRDRRPFAAVRCP